MVDDQEQSTTRLCRICGKIFSNGRSLGGHMRSHLSLDDATFMDDEDDPKKTWRLSDDDYESEEESDSEVSAVTKNGKRRRRRRRLRRVAAITYDSCSVSESEKEDGALSLMMLSRDYYCSIGIGLPKKKTYKCATCDRVFESYQALGGHRTSHRNESSSTSSIAEKKLTQQRSGGGGGASAVVYECLVCHKVFPSGQALGGHKRRHASRSLHI